MFRLTLCAICLLPSACALDDQLTNPDIGISDARLHAVMTKQLDTHIARLNILTFDLHRTQTELEAERMRQAGQIADTAGDLQRSAGDIVALAPSLQLSEDAAAQFSRLASTLDSHAAQLETLAATGSIEDIASVMADINATCNACHSLYRRQ